MCRSRVLPKTRNGTREGLWAFAKGPLVRGAPESINLFLFFASKVIKAQGEVRKLPFNSVIKQQQDFEQASSSIICPGPRKT